MSDMRFQIEQAVCAFFHVDADAARGLAPPGLRLLLAHSGVAVLNVAVLAFSDSPVGSYRELLISLAVVPWAGKEGRLPLAAFYPIHRATSTAASRAAHSQWHLPQQDQLIDVEFQREQSFHHARIRAGGSGVLDLSVATEDDYQSAKRLYQSFSSRDAALYRFAVQVEGLLNEHEDQRGSLSLGPHPDAGLLRDLVQDSQPFREQSIVNGKETVGPLELHSEC